MTVSEVFWPPILTGMTAWGYHAWWPVLGVAALLAVPWLTGRFIAHEQEPR